MTKTNKSFSKRLRITKNGKIIARKPGGNHFNAKEGRGKQLNRKRTTLFVMKNKTRGRFFQK